jgi:hypothetical protein
VEKGGGAVKDRLTINSEPSKTVAFQQLEQLYAEHKYVTIEYRLGQDRSLDQNALLHVWVGEMIEFYTQKIRKSYEKNDWEDLMSGTKRMLKANCYNQNPDYRWLVHKIKDAQTGKERVDYRSSANYLQGEMFMFLTWLQLKASFDGIVLESKGEYAKLARESNA